LDFTLKEIVFMPLDELLQAKRADILQTARKYGAYNVRVFGSVARGEADDKSDIDLLVDMEKGRSLLDLAGLLVDLEELLGCKVDVVPEDSLRERIRGRVLKEAVAL
jgi:predicted nucleotidyltransferase